MGLINTYKEAALSLLPLFLFDITLSSGTVRRVSTHPVTYAGHAYEPRVLSQSIDPIQALSPEGIEIPASVRLAMADADLALSALDRSDGFKGARVVTTFVYYDIAAHTFSSDAIVPFIGRCDQPELNYGDGTLSLTASYILNLQAKNLPSFPIQPRCPKLFPATAAQKAAAVNPRSIFYPCGVTDPTKTSCNYTQANCTTNGVPLRFGGCVYNVPPGSHSREYTTGNWLDQTSDPNEAKYGDFAPIGYGTAWVDCLSLGDWPEGNSTRGEAIVCEGRPESILKVTVEDTELAPANGLDGSTYVVKDVLMRYNVISTGDRDGALNTDSPWNGTGDPHGSQCVIEWVLPRKLTGTPRIRALVKFPKVLHYQKILSITSGVVTFANNATNRDVAGNSPFTITISGSSNGALNATWGLSSWTSGPPGTVTLSGTSASGTGGYLSYAQSSDQYAWAILDELQRVGLADVDTDIDSFVAASEFHAGSVSYVARDGTTQQHARYTCSMVIRQRRSVAEILNGLLRGCNSHLTRNLATGKIGLFFRGTLAQQQATLPDGSNYSTTISSGKVAYHFDESSILQVNGKSTLRRVGRAGASIPNSVTVPFANEENDYSGDSVRLVDTDDVNLMGQEITGNLQVDGGTSVDRAQRVGAIYLAEQIDGEPWEWETSHKAVKLQVGQIVALSSTEAGFSLQLMRLQKIEPAANWETARITATIHNNAWYADTVEPQNDSTLPRRNRLSRPSFGWSPYQVQPAVGDPVYARTEWTYGLSVGYGVYGNGAPRPVALITGRVPVNEPANLLAPALAYQGTTASSGGTLAGDGKVYFVALASYDGAGLPGPLSNVCQVAVAQAGTSNKITIPISFLDPAGSGYYVFAGRNPMRLASTNDVGYAGAPSSIDVTAIPEATWGAPDTEYDTISIRPRLVAHSGPFAITLSAVGTNTITVTGAGWSTDQWLGYDCCILAKADLSELPVLNFRVSSNTATVLTLATDPSALGVAAGDLLSMLSKPLVSGLVVTDANWANSLSAGGLGFSVDAEKGKMARAIAGTGRGHRYPIASNTATDITLAGPWITAWDSTTRYVVEEPGDLPAVDTAGQANSDPGAVMSIEARLENYAGRVVLFEVVTLDGGGNESPPDVNPVRMAYVAGAQGTRTITDSDTQLVTDGLVLCDASGVTQPAATTLSAAITTTSQTAISLTSGGSTINGTDILIGTERLRIVSGGGTGSVDVERGAAGTTAATHSIGAAVTLPGGLTFTCLASGDVPNVSLLVKKTDTSINYVSMLAGGSDKFDNGSTVTILADTTDAAGLKGVRFPG